MSDILSIGASGVRAYQTALTTVSDNISNAGTAGYSRRTAALSEVSAVSARAAAGTATGNGVAVTGTLRAGDELKQAAVRSAGSDVARTSSSITWLQQIQSALNDNTLPSNLTAFFNAAKAVAADPTANTPRTAFIEAGTSVANAFALTGTALDKANETVNASGQNAVTSLNGLLGTLAQVNNGLGIAEPGTPATAQLLDQRDQVLQQVSAISNTTVSFDERGRVTLRLGDNSGPVALAGDTAAYVSYTRSNAGAVSFVVSRGGTVASLNPTGGALAGIVDGAQRIDNARLQLNDIATDFTTAINDFQAQGRDLNGNPGVPFFSVGATPTDISLAITDPSTIAAAAVGGGKRDNTNINSLETVRSQGNFEGNLTTVIAANASTLSARKQVSDAQNTIFDGAVAARDAVSGVSLDTEAVDLIRFQQAYQAAGRVIQVAQDTFQTVLNIR